jgi:hypothetical protein
MDANRKASLIGGLLWLTTFVASIPAFFIFYAPVLNEANYVLGAGEDARVATGVVLEVVLIIANVGTALALLPVLRRQNYALAHGYVAARIMECVFIAAGILAVLAVLGLRSQVADGSMPSDNAVSAAASSLVAVHDASFLLGPGLLVGVGNGLLLGYLMYRSGLVPRWMATLALIAGPLVIASGILVLYSVIEPGSGVQALMTAPEFVWELSLGLYLTFKGYQTVPILTAGSTRTAEPVYAAV